MRNIYWTELGADTYASLILFYFEYSEKLSIEIDSKVEKLLMRLSKFNFSCPVSPKLPRFRRCVINAEASLIYEIIENEVFIVAVVDNRANHLYF
jgi:hypothetical protein